MAYSYQVFDSDEFHSVNSQPTPAVQTQTSTMSHTSRGSESSTPKDWSQRSQLSSKEDQYDTLYSRNLELFFYVVLSILILAVFAMVSMFISYQLFGKRGQATETTITPPSTGVVLTVSPSWPTWREYNKKKTKGVTPRVTTTIERVPKDKPEPTPPPLPSGPSDASPPTLGDFRPSRDTGSTISGSDSFLITKSEEVSAGTTRFPIIKSEEVNTGTTRFPIIKSEEVNTGTHRFPIFKSEEVSTGTATFPVIKSEEIGTRYGEDYVTMFIPYEEESTGNDTFLITKSEGVSAGTARFPIIKSEEVSSGTARFPIFKSEEVSTGTARLPIIKSEGVSTGTARFPIIKSEEVGTGTARFPIMKSEEVTIGTARFPTVKSEEESTGTARFPIIKSEEVSIGTARFPIIKSEEASTGTARFPVIKSEEVSAGTARFPIIKSEEVSTDGDGSITMAQGEDAGAEARHKGDIVWRERFGEDTNKVRTPVPSNSLICTFGAKMNQRTAFPPDGLCSFVFFDSLYRNKANVLGRRLQPNMLHFLRHARKYNRTTYGVGLDFQSSREVEEFLDGDTALETLADFISKGIHHYGCINTPVAPVSPGDVKRVLEVLQKVDSIISIERRVDRPLYTAMTASLWSDEWFKGFVKLFKTVFTPDIVIMYGHVFAEDQEWKRCQIVPPTLMALPRYGSYVYSLKSAHEDMEALQRTGIKATLAVSLAMFGRWYTPRYPDLSRPSVPGNFSLFNKCKWSSEDQLGSKTEVCKKLIWHSQVFSNRHLSAYFYDKAREKTFTFDTANALRAKLCSLKQRFISLRYSLAAFNLEYADGRDKCGEGDFAELRALRQLVDFMDTDFTSETSYEVCVSLSLPAYSSPAGPWRRLRRGRRNHAPRE